MLRFIPACAGNSSSHAALSLWIAVHPRVCGEQFKGIGTYPKQNGSSPRVRGTGSSTDRPYLMTRFIPACAGNRNSNALR